MNGSSTDANPSYAYTAAGDYTVTLTVTDDDIPCRCGGSGCLETVASQRAVLARARDLAASERGWALAGGVRLLVGDRLENVSRYLPHGRTIIITDTVVRKLYGDRLPEADVIVVPVGGGGLIAGLATAARQ